MIPFGISQNCSHR